MPDNDNTDTQSLPKSVWSGSFWLGNVEMKCHVLDTGQAIIEAESMDNLFSDWATEPTVDQYAAWSKWFNSVN